MDVLADTKNPTDVLKPTQPPQHMGCSPIVHAITPRTYRHAGQYINVWVDTLQNMQMHRAALGTYGGVQTYGGIGGIRGHPNAWGIQIYGMSECIGAPGCPPIVKHTCH